MTSGLRVRFLAVFVNAMIFVVNGCSSLQSEESTITDIVTASFDR